MGSLKTLRVLQVVPALNSGGVERGTIDFARYLVENGHESIVLSSGGSLVAKLESEGTQHYQLDVEKKSPKSLNQVKPIRQLLLKLKPDIVHVRSRLPAWLVWLAWRRMDKINRPSFVTTFHGLYSVNFYSAIMARGERVIAISPAVKEYILENYKGVDENNIRLIERGVDIRDFSSNKIPQTLWADQLYHAYPQLIGKKIILFPGRITSWKGQLDFLRMFKTIKQLDKQYHGVIVGSHEKKQEKYAQQLQNYIVSHQLSDTITLMGERKDIANIYAISSLVCNLSSTPEPFGRTLIEAIACGTPVFAKNEGGPGEILKHCYAEGIASGNDPTMWAAQALKLIQMNTKPVLPERYTTPLQSLKTLKVYQELLDAKGN
jgi:glycosyltransferase involved in cell wall biosynthesis